MGKYMRKAKITSDVAVMELPQSSLGVRTRAKTLALQRLQASNSPPTPNPNPNPPVNDSSYLQLRSRRLEKPNDAVKATKSSCKQNLQLNRCPINPNPKTGSRLRPVNTGSVGSDSVSFSEKEKGCFGERILVASKEEGEAEDYADLGVEASFGDNNLEFESRERSTRESTPCSLIRGSDTIGTPGSSTRPTSLTVSNQLCQNSMQRDIPTTQEMEEFFTFAEQQQQRLFTEKYNFDVVNDLPLPGRYEWVRVYP